MIVNIRGGLGMQILELLHGMALAKENGEQIEEVRINVGGNVVDHVRMDWISQLFTLPYPVTISPGINKQKVWREEAFERIINTGVAYDLARKMHTHITETRYSSILHVRATDRQVIDLDAYVDLCDFFYKERPYYPKAIVTDNRSFAQEIIKKTKIPNMEIVGGNPVEDWRLMYNADCVWGGFSSFTASVMFLDPMKKYKIIDKMMSRDKVIDDESWECLDMLLNNTTNGQFV